MRASGSGSSEWMGQLAVQSSPQSNGRTTRSVERVARSISQAFIRRPYQALTIRGFPSSQKRFVTLQFRLSRDERAIEELHERRHGFDANYKLFKQFGRSGYFRIELGI